MYQKHLWMTGGGGGGGGRASSVSSPWSRLQDKLFEQALVLYPDETPDRWERIACQVPGKTAWEVREHYQALIYDVMEIDSGRVQLPSYADDDDNSSSNSFRSNWESDCSRRTSNQISFGSTKNTKQSETERKKGVPWTEEEHKLFLIGLKKYGKGDWRSISRNAVQSRTPTQVASHAQKYYLRLNSEKKEKKRSSIHDITTVENNNSVSQPNNQGQDSQSGILDQPGATGSYPGQRGGYPMYQHQFNFPM